MGERIAAHLRRHQPQEGQTLALVTHGVALTALLCHLLGRELAATRADRSTLHDSAAYSARDLDPASRAVLRARIAQTPHLKELR